MSIVCGLDLGQSRDYTALSILERVPVPGTKPTYNVRYLDRYKLGTKYPDIVDAVRDMLLDPRLRGAKLVVDATGVGRPVVDMFVRARMKPIAITITASGQPHEVEPRWWNVAKRDLVSTMQVLLQSRRLQMGPRIRNADKMREELDDFTVKITAAAHDTYEAWREGTHDDLVLSVALAAWWGEHGKRSPFEGSGLPVIQAKMKGWQP